jgi:hypothetical protein
VGGIYEASQGFRRVEVEIIRVNDYIEEMVKFDLFTKNADSDMI